MKAAVLPLLDKPLATNPRKFHPRLAVHEFRSWKIDREIKR